MITTISSIFVDGTNNLWVQVISDLHWKIGLGISKLVHIKEESRTPRLLFVLARAGLLSIFQCVITATLQQSINLKTLLVDSSDSMPGKSWGVAESETGWWTNHPGIMFEWTGRHRSWWGLFLVQPSPGRETERKFVNLQYARLWSLLSSLCLHMNVLA